MLYGRGAFGWPLSLPLVVALLSLSGAGCHRRSEATAPAAAPTSAAPATTALATLATAPAAATAPSTEPAPPLPRSPGEFVRSPRRIVLAAAEVRLPIDLVTYMPELSFTTADGVRRRAILDTGSDSILVAPAFVSGDRLTTRPSDRTFRDASGTGSGAAVAAVDKLELGPAKPAGVVRFEDFDVDVAGLYAGADALLGWPMWRDLLVTIDYPHGQLVLKRAGPADALPPPDGKRVLPLRFDYDRLMVPATLAGRETWLNLDTGWGVGCSVELTADRAAEVRWASPPRLMMATNTAQGVAAEELGRLEGDLLLGRYRFVRPVAGTNTGLAADILASVALARFTVTLDLHNMRVAFDRDGDAPILPEPVFVAGFDCDLRSRPLKVTGVLADSEAERAGLRGGDLLLTIDGRPGLDGLLSHAGGPFAIELQRGDRKMTLSVPMTKLVP